MRLLCAALCVALVGACGDPAATPLSPNDAAASLDEALDVTINDEVWPDRTIEDEPVEIPMPGDSSDAEISALALAPEPLIRVGVVYADLNAQSLRVGGKDDLDPFELRTTAGVLLASGAGEVVATRTSGTIRLTLPHGTTITTGNSVLLSSASGIVRIRRFTSDASQFRGTAEVRFNAARTALVAINQLPIEQYLYGVVPRELGPIAFPEVEAQKTQAVAARTFARRRIQFCPVSRCSHGYHVVPTTADQVYGGRTAEHPVSTQAVELTRGVVATYNGGLIEALYSSTTGGFTANSEDVFTNALPYLRGVPDHERGKAMDHVPTLDVFRNHGNPTNLRNHANGDFEADWSIYHRWYVDWTKEEMRQVAGRIQSATFIDPGEVYSIDVVERSSSGRVLRIAFVTEKRGTLTATKDAVRSALRYVTYNSSGGMVLNSLRSTLVYVEPVISPQTKEIVGWEAWGGGWGHGTGVGQTGAVGMAEKGRTYQDILAHYYRGVVLEQRW